MLTVLYSIYHTASYPDTIIQYLIVYSIYPITIIQYIEYNTIHHTISGYLYQEEWSLTDWSLVFVLPIYCHLMKLYSMQSQQLQNSTKKNPSHCYWSGYSVMHVSLNDTTQCHYMTAHMYSIIPYLSTKIKYDVLHFSKFSYCSQ